MEELTALESVEALSDQVDCINPVMMPGGGVTATFYGEVGPGVDNVIGYDTDEHNLWLYPFTYQGTNGYAYCLIRGVPAPQGPVGNVSAAQAMPGVSEMIHRAVAWVIANAPAPPGDDPEGTARFWNLLGINCGRGWDAYGVSQLAIWTLLGQIERNGFVFLPPGDQDCLIVAYNRLIDIAIDYATGNLNCSGGGGAAGSGCGGDGGSGGTGGGSCCGSGSSCSSSQACSSTVIPFGCQIGRIVCCNTSRRPANTTEPFLIFVGCPNDLREYCGRVLIGPFRLAASSGGTPTITLRPCNCCTDVAFDIVDHCGRPTTPEVCNEFYISFRPPSPNFCFELCAEIDVTITSVYFFREPGGLSQNMGIPIRRRVRRRTCIQVCIELTPPPPPPPLLPPPPPPAPPPGDVTVNNNNNNNNNANSSNNNSTMQTLMETLLLSSMLGQQPASQPVPVPVPQPVPVPVEHPVHVPYPAPCPVPCPMPYPEPCFVPPPDIFVCQPQCGARPPDFASMLGNW